MMDDALETLSLRYCCITGEMSADIMLVPQTERDFCRGARLDLDPIHSFWVKGAAHLFSSAVRAMKENLYPLKWSPPNFPILRKSRPDDLSFIHYRRGLNISHDVGIQAR
jgi:hypothetical protein